MPHFIQTAQAITSLEQLSQNNTVFHRIHPMSKLFITVFYIICVISYPPYQFSALLIFLFYPLIAMELAEIPFTLLLKRACLALPFSLFAGLSNLLLDRTVLFSAGPVPITAGFVSCCSILLKTFLCVTAVLILIATTPFPALAKQLRKFHLPAPILFLFLLIFRYLSVLLEEAKHMYHAYQLRTPRAKGINMQDMGSFLAQLLIRSFDRAERIYHAMKCRGFDGTFPLLSTRPAKWSDWVTGILLCGLFITCRFYNIPAIIGNLFGGVQF
jgi:cobalt/nickel transport system permease protein